MGAATSAEAAAGAVATSRLYVETAEPWEGELWEPWWYLMCADCDWCGPGYDSYREAERDRWRHPAWLCALKLRWNTWRWNYGA